MLDAPIAEAYNGGLVLYFFDSPEYEFQDDTNTDALARDFVRMHMLPWEEKAARVWYSRRIQKALVYRYDAEFIRSVRQVYYEGFVRVYSQLKTRELLNKLTPAQHNQANLFISDCFSSLPFADPNPYEHFKFPQLIHGTWMLVDYTVQLIELTKPTYASKDKVFAYGFEPLIEQDAPSHIVFPGTTYAAGRGFVTQMGANMDAFEMVGRSLYLSGYEGAGVWLDKQNRRCAPQRPQAHGKSQGGSLALHLAMHQGDKLSEVNAFNPPGLHEVDRSDDVFDRWNEPGFKRPLVRVLENSGDWVHRYGKRKPEWLGLYLELRHQSGVSGIDHASNFAARPGLTIKQRCPRAANLDRQARDPWVYSRFRASCRYLLYWPYVNLIRPIQLPFMMMLGTMMVCSLLPPILAVPMLVVVGVTCLVLAVLDLHAYWTRNVVEEPAHWLSAPRVPEMDTYQANINAKFSVHELGQYYHVKREVLKDKKSHASTNSHVRFFKEDGSAYPKVELLEDNARNCHLDWNVRVKATPAKLADIRDTLACLDDDNALREQDAHYRAGKGFK
jgi:hypothetical protein